MNWRRNASTRGEACFLFAVSVAAATRRADKFTPALRGLSEGISGHVGKSVPEAAEGKWVQHKSRFQGFITKLFMIRL